MNKLILIGFMVMLIMVVGFISYQLGLNQNVGNETKIAIDKWCEENDTNCVRYCDESCYFDNLRCSNPDYFG